jgi:hypothetical protein
MGQKFKISVDRATDMVRIEMTGFFSSDEVEVFAQAVADNVAKLGAPPNMHVTLCDISTMNIQAQDVVGAFAQLVGSSAVRSRKLAFITQSSLARQQATRLTDRPGVRFFTGLREAEDWLKQNG